MNRRHFLALCAALGLTACAPKTSNPDGPTSNEPVIPRGWDGEPRPLPIPPLLDGDETDGRYYYKLTAQTGETEILPGIKTATWGFNGAMLGPTIHASRNHPVDLEFTSELPETTAVHCHGLLLPANMDGGPHSTIEPGATWTSSFTVNQPALTAWYHPHPHGKTGVQAYRGLAGMIIIDDDVEQALGIPHDYGVDDIPIVIMDANFTDDGQLDETFDPNLGLQGAVPHVNGITNPEFTATKPRARFRLLNGSNMRFHNLGFDDGREFQVIATDSGLLDRPRKATSVRLGPGERAEIVADVTGTMKLRSLGYADNLGVPQDEYSLDFKLQEQVDLLTIRGPVPGNAPGTIQRADQGEDVTVNVAAPDVLDPAAAAPIKTATIERKFELNTFQINGKSMDMNRVDVVIDHSDPETWIVTNGNSDWIHNFHIHNCAFKVLEVSDTNIQFDAYGWKDTVTIPPGVTVKLGILFGQYRNNHYPYMYHCHMLFHEDKGMMGQYMMVEPGEEPDLQTDYTAHGGHGGHSDDSGSAESTESSTQDESQYE